ncbi:hypothetical protein ACLM7F_24375, partial [Salmonella enterica subsp. enterica]|uniref:hypothetical protein n=1 Tax=Salmonella enterica TaxID=28901 RepID=UPI003D34FABC
CFLLQGRPDFTSCPTADKPEHGQDAGQKAGDKDTGQQQENQRAERGDISGLYGAFIRHCCK